MLKRSCSAWRGAVACEHARGSHASMARGRAVGQAPWARDALTYAQQLVQLEQANRAFEQALMSPTHQDAQGYYQQAIAGYEQLVAAGIHNAKLYYNLGNAYFRLNDLGHAIYTIGAVCVWSQATASYRPI